MPNPATHPIAPIRLTRASRAGHSARFEVSMRRTVPAGPLAAPKKPARRVARENWDMVPHRAIAKRATPLPRKPIRRKILRRAVRSESDPHRMNAGAEARLVAAAMIPTGRSDPPRAYANRGISVDVAPPATACRRDEEDQ